MISKDGSIQKLEVLSGASAAGARRPVGREAMAVQADAAERRGGGGPNEHRSELHPQRLKHASRPWWNREVRASGLPPGACSAELSSAMAGWPCCLAWCRLAADGR